MFYRPISLLPIVSKVFENLFLKRLLRMVENNTVTPIHQFGIRQRHYTIQQTNRIAGRINEALENKQYCSATFLVIQGAAEITPTFRQITVGSPKQVVGCGPVR
jgi:hypothetical protein